MNKILVATDLSKGATLALQRAALIAKSTGASLEVVHVLDSVWPDEELDRQEQAARDIIASHLPSDLANTAKVTMTILRGQDYVEIVKRATDGAADVIVLGAHRNKILELFRGTTSERIIRLGHIPVLVVNTAAKEPYRRLLLAYDFSPHAQRALQFAAEWLPKSEIHLVHAMHVPFKGFLGQETQEQFAVEEREKIARMIDHDISNLKKKLGASCPTFKVSINEAEPQTMLQNLVRETSPDLLVLGTHGRTGILHMVLGSTAEELIAIAAVDVLAVNA